MNNAKSTIHGGLYDFLSEAKKRTTPSTDSTKENIKDIPPPSFVSSQTAPAGNNSSDQSYNNESYHKIAPIIPKNFNFIIKAATFSAVKENSQNDFSAKMQLFSVSTYRFCIYYLYIYLYIVSQYIP